MFFWPICGYLFSYSYFLSLILTDKFSVDSYLRVLFDTTQTDNERG